MMAPRISIVIPCYNAEATIGETLESAFAQGAGVEIIAIDDGSTDGTADVLRSYGTRITALFGPNNGVSEGRNTAFAASTGDWIQFLDSDDLLTPGTVARRIEAAGEAYDVVITDWREFSVSGGVVTDGRSRAINPADLAQAEIAIARDLWAPPVAVLYRRSVVERVGGFRDDLPVIQDARFLFDAAYHGARFTHLPEVGGRYRVAEGSLSRRSPAKFWADVLLNGRQIEALWSARGPISDDQNAVLFSIYNNAARGLFAAADPRFFEAVADLRRLGRVPLHARLAEPLARVTGLKTAHRLLSLIGRG